MGTHKPSLNIFHCLSFNGKNACLLHSLTVYDITLKYLFISSSSYALWKLLTNSIFFWLYTK